MKTLSGDSMTYSPYCGLALAKKKILTKMSASNHSVQLNASLVSVALPVYNGAEYLAEAIKSIISTRPM